MALYFLDSSAVVKRYHFEAGTVWVRAACRRRVRPNDIFTSQLAEIEVVAALRQIARTRNAHPSVVEALIAEFRRDVTYSYTSVRTTPYRIIPITQPIIDVASELCDHFWQANPRPLRTLDAIQLATALSMQANISGEFEFVSGDTRLLQVANSLSLATINPDIAPIPTEIGRSHPDHHRPPQYLSCRLVALLAPYWYNAPQGVVCATCNLSR